MSIYTTLLSLDDSNHDDACAVWVQIEPGVFGRSGKPCDCGQPDTPLVYQGSHVLPADTDPRGGYIEFASIPGFITRDGRDDGPDDEATPWPYLRFSTSDGGVVLTRDQAKQIHETLGLWLENTK